jgi:hypothetical protein
MAHQGSNKARNQTRSGGVTNAAWLEKNKQKRRKHRKIAKQSRRFNRKK